MCKRSVGAELEKRELKRSTLPSFAKNFFSEVKLSRTASKYKTENEKKMVSVCFHPSEILKAGKFTSK